MKFEEVKKGKTYFKTHSTGTRKRGGRERRKDVVKVFVLEKDEVNKRLLVSFNGAPSEWCESPRFWVEDKNLLKA